MSAGITRSPFPATAIEGEAIESHAPAPCASPLLPALDESAAVNLLGLPLLTGIRQIASGTS